MAYQISADRVKAILEIAEYTDSNLEADQAPAKILIDENLLDKGLSDNTLNEIGAWLVCHYKAQTNSFAVVKEVIIGDEEEKYQGRNLASQGLPNTIYGQQAITLDRTNTLRNLPKPTPKLSSLGEPC